MGVWFHKSRIYPLILALAVVIVWFIRQPKSNSLQKVEVTGQTMGSIRYNVKYLDSNGSVYKKEIDSILHNFNQSLSTYIPDSEISRFNRETVFKFESPYFYPVLVQSKNVHRKTKGAFDPTIAPLVNAWGFGPDKSKAPTSDVVDSLLSLVNFDSLYFDSVSVCKMKKGMMLDLSAIAKGYAVDVIADFLKSKGIENLMVEIGGEAVCYGVNDRDEVWAIGIDNPEVSYGDNLQAIVRLKDRAIATSGNYRNYYEVDGKRFAHTISPYTGYPVQHSLLSASVFANDCMTADAYATAFMVLGVEESLKILEKEENLDAYLIYSDDDGSLKTFISEGIKEFFIK